MLFNLDEMEKRLADLDAERDPLVALIAAARTYEGTVGKVVRQTANVTIRHRPNPGIATVTAQTLEVAANLIAAKGAPVPTRDVVAEMQRLGLSLPEKNPLNVISARLSSQSALKGRRDMGWWPANKPWPDEGRGESGTLPGLQDQNTGGADVIANG